MKLCRNCGEREDDHCPECSACFYDGPYCYNPACDGECN